MIDLTKFTKRLAVHYFQSKGMNKINILEAGSADGSDTNFFCHFFPQSKICGFEPDPRYRSRFERLSSSYNNLIYTNKALSNYNGKTKFYLSSRHDENNNVEVWCSSSVLKPKDHLEIHPQIKFNDCIEVECCRLDDWMSQNNIEKFDMMWLDMQGHEYDVIESSPKCTEGCHLIYSEVQLIESYEGNKLYVSLRDLMKSRGFTPVIEELPWKDAGNVLFAREDVSKDVEDMIREIS